MGVVKKTMIFQTLRHSRPRTLFSWTRHLSRSVIGARSLTVTALYARRSNSEAGA